ncbi:MAG: glycosyltransferase family 39 protein [Actinomycetota bacterium]
MLPIFGITVAAAVLGFFRIGNASLWLDESVSVNLARVPFTKFASIAAHKEANMALYYLLLRLWMLFGSSEGWIRGLSALAGVATIPVLYVLCSKLFGRTVALIAASLLTVNGFFIHYQHEARSYALAAFAVTVSTLLLVRATEKSTMQRWLAYGAVAGLSLYVHFFAGFVVLAQALMIVVRVIRRSLDREALFSLLPIAALAAPIGLFLTTQKAGQIAWIPATTLRSVVPTFKAITGLGGLPLLALYFVACVAGSIFILRMPREKRWSGTLVVLWFAVPTVLMFGISLITPLVRPQYLSVAVPPLVVLASLGVSWLRKKIPIVIALAVVVALAGSELPSGYRHLQTHDWRSAERFVASNSHPGDGIVFYYYYGWTPFSFYADQEPGKVPTSRYPASSWSASSFVVDQPLAPYLSTATRDPRIWLVLNNARTDHPTAELSSLLEGINTSYSLVEQREFQGGIRIRLYVRVTATANP